MGLVGAILSTGLVLAACSSEPAPPKIQLPPASAIWGRTYANDGYAQNVSFFPSSAQTRVTTDGTVVVVVGDVVGAADGPTSLGSGLVAMLDATNGAPLFEQTLTARAMPPQQSYALVSGLSAAIVPDGVIVAGFLVGTMTLGAEAPASLDYSGPFLAKLDRAGQVIWAKFPGTGSISQVRADAAGNVYLVGSVQGQLDFGGGAFPPVSEYGTGMTHLYIAKLDPAGTQLFVDAYPVTATGPHEGSSAAWALVLDPNGNATWVGSFLGSVDFGSGPWSSTTFLAQTGAAGESIQVRSLGQTSISDLALDPTGAPILVGSCRSPVTLAGEVVPCATTSGFIAKLGDLAPDYFDEIAIDPSVTVTDYEEHTYPGFVALLGVAVDRGGNAFVAGAFGGDLTIGDVTVPWTPAFSGNVIYGDWKVDALLAGFDPSGQPFWAEGFGDESNQVGQSVAVDTTGRVFAMGWLAGAIDFGDNVAFTAAKSSDIFVAAFSP